MRHTIVIGGGVAGLFAAIAAAEAGDRVTVAERGRKPLKKLSVTGNGRGNLLNLGRPVFYGDEAFALAVLEHLPPRQVAGLWERLGVPLVEEDEGRVYPACFLASAAVDALLLRARQLGITFLTNLRVGAVRKDKTAFQVAGVRTLYAEDTLRKNGKAKPGAAVGEEVLHLTCDRVILATGGAAAPAHGTDGTAYGLLMGFGHSLVEPRPALCALVTEKAPLRGLEGQRARAALTLYDGAGRKLHSSRGEALFAADGVSGIAAMQLARFVAEGCTLHMDLTPAVLGRSADAASVSHWLADRCRIRPGLPLRELLTGAAAPPLGHALLRAARLPLDGPAETLRPSALETLARTMGDFTLEVKGVRGFESAQVTGGGISADGFDPATLESRLCPGLYAAGEVLNVDGDCGGYNLLFAAASGYLAGRS